MPLDVTELARTIADNLARLLDLDEDEREKAEGAVMTDLFDATHEVEKEGE